MRAMLHECALVCKSTFGPHFSRRHSPALTTRHYLIFQLAGRLLTGCAASQTRCARAGASLQRREQLVYRVPFIV